ncbi:hypothetical protein FJZ53_07015 [Candidatus Woesearchaeota archaeon]|nr:hypothetical protein [Candidatus Woesearchaeota archaeon]
MENKKKTKDESILIGVDHAPAYLDEVVSFLERRKVSNKKVMIETPCHPLPLRYYKRNLSYCKFYDGLYQYLHKKGACIIHGDSEELIEKAYKKLLRRGESCIPFSWFPEYKKIVCEERDHHFYKVYKKHHPEIIIIDSLHATYFRERISCKYKRIPKED